MLLVRRVVGTSMQPTLTSGQVVIGSKIIKPRIGSIIIFTHLGREKIKRISAIRGKDVTVVGDNRQESDDSRSYGPIKTSDVKAVIIWPRQSRTRR